MRHRCESGKKEYSSQGACAWEGVLVLKLEHGSICLFNTESSYCVVGPAGECGRSPSSAGKMDKSADYGQLGRRVLSVVAGPWVGGAQQREGGIFKPDLLRTGPGTFQEGRRVGVQAQRLQT